MRHLLTLIICAACATGCTHAQLKRSTLRQGGTVADLQYQQVLTNLATYACNFESLPWHVKLNGGVIQVTDQGGGAFGAELPTEGPSLFLPSASGQRTVVGQWDVEPATEPDELEHLRLAYQLALKPGDPELRKEVYQAIGELSVEYRVLPSEKTLAEVFRLLGDPDPSAGGEAGRAAKLAELREAYRAAREEAFLPPKERKRARKLLAELHEWVAEGHLKLGPEEVAASHNLAEIEQVTEKIEKLQELLENPQFQSPWVVVGCKKDVPACGCPVGRYKGCHGECHAWVMPENYKTLREFTLIVLALAPKDRQELSPGGPVYSAGAAR